MCIMCAADSEDNYFCAPCWKSLPDEYREVWWKLHDYGHRKPTDEEVHAFVDSVRGTNGVHKETKAE